MDYAEAAVFTVMGLSLVADFLFTWLFLRTPELREGPGELIFLQNQVQIILDLHWLTLLWTSKQTVGCGVLGFLTMFSYMLSCAYAAAICVAVCEHFEQPKVPRVWRYHAVVISVSLVICVAMAADKGLGTSVLGTCSVIDGHWTE
jgi:hypothetical protein